MTATQYAGDEILAKIEAIEELKRKQEELANKIADIYREAKSSGLCHKTIRQIVRLRAIDPATLREMTDKERIYLQAISEAERRRNAFPPSDPVDADESESPARAPVRAPASTRTPASAHAPARTRTRTREDFQARTRDEFGDENQDQPEETTSASARHSRRTAQETPAGDEAIPF